MEVPLLAVPVEPVRAPADLGAPHAVKGHVGREAGATVGEGHARLVGREVDGRPVRHLLLVLLLHVHAVVLVDRLPPKVCKVRGTRVKISHFKIEEKQEKQQLNKKNFNNHLKELNILKNGIINQFKKRTKD